MVSDQHYPGGNRCVIGECRLYRPGGTWPDKDFKEGVQDKRVAARRNCVSEDARACRPVYKWKTKEMGAWLLEIGKGRAERR
jgi:hypothetical protein